MLAVILCIMSATLISAQADGESHNYLDVQTPNTFQYNSPLHQPDSLRSRPYFDFLSTLYRHDPTKTSLFSPYAVRTRRSAADPKHVALLKEFAENNKRSKRAIVFRPLFVYKQQEIKKQEYAKRKRRY
ncbi:uncharacterized protein LOC119683063 [Teleopsis dalmanni]|uniref:uncharacterized protein LOC119683063 n=1 Tax=Teleopsis dalmanni TaxID=139649 RepID=UPI0018CF825B|nr:uncharacterized protein LOC119683063 [Teleopsis dalmanni]